MNCVKVNEMTRTQAIQIILSINIDVCSFGVISYFTSKCSCIIALHFGYIDQVYLQAAEAHFDSNSIRCTRFTLIILSITKLSIG